MSTFKKPGNGLNVGHANVYHITNKIHDVCSLLNGPPCLDLLGLTETRLRLQSDQQISIPNYSFFRKDASRVLHTGIGVYARNDIIHCITRRPDLESKMVESMWVEFKRSSVDSLLLIGFVYRNPSSSYSWYDDFVQMMDRVTERHPKAEIILLGDFNINLLKPHVAWESTLSLFGLQPVISQATRVTRKTSTLLDHIYTNNTKKMSSALLSDVSLSDHCPVICTWSVKPLKCTKGEHTTVEYRSFKNFDKDLFLNDLHHVTFAEVYNSNTPDDALAAWYSIVMPIIDKHAPIRRKRVKHKTLPGWLTREIVEAMKTRDELKKKKKFDEYKQQRNKVSVLVKNAKKAYFNKLISNHCDTAHLWRAMNEITHKTRTSQPSSAAHFSPDSLNAHFLSSASLPPQSASADAQNSSHYSVLTKFCRNRLRASDTCDIPNIAVHEVGKYIMSLKNKKSVGLDNISTYILKLALPYTVGSLTFMYNMCINTHTFPIDWKAAKVIPLPKSRDLSDPNNFRPISILSNLSKPLEKHIHKHLVDFLENHSLFYHFQSGFRKYHSCHTALTRMCDSWLSSVNASSVAGAVFLDFKKAFDLVDHEIIINKLKIYLQNEPAVSLLSSFLDYRTQTVYVHGGYSCQGHVLCGVPQGSVLGPILFCIFINDLPMHVTNDNVSCDLFADDSSLHTAAPDIAQVQSNLQEGLNNVTNWCEVNKMVLHPQKTKSLVITTRQKHQREPLRLGLTLGANPVEQVNSHRVLGVTIDNMLRWDLHITNVTRTVAKNLYLLAKLKCFVDADARKLFFVAHCLSHINYASTIWSGAAEVHLMKLNSLHRRAAKLIVTNPYMNTAEKLKAANILPLKQQFDFNMATLVFKVQQGLVPAFLESFLTKAPKRYGSNNLILPRTRIDLFKSSFAFAGPYVWNSLPLDVRASKTVSVFKTSLRKHYFRT